MERMTRRLSFGNRFEIVRGTYSQIENSALIYAWNNSCKVEVCEMDDNGCGFGDATFGNWGFISCPSESAFLNACKDEARNVTNIQWRAA